MFDRLWDRFELLHGEIIAYAGCDRSIIESAVQVYNEQSHRRTDLQDKVTQYLQLAETSWKDNLTAKGNVDTLSKCIDKSERVSIRSASSSVRSFEAQLK